MRDEMAEEVSTLDDAFFKRVTGLILNELAEALPDQADRAAALLGLVVNEIAAIEDREDRVQLCTDAYRAFYHFALTQSRNRGTCVCPLR